MCILTSLEELPPNRERSCTRITLAPLRAAATAAQTPAMPPPAMNTSQARSSIAMFGSPAKRVAVEAGSGVRPLFSTAPGVAARLCAHPLTLTNALHDEAAANCKKSRRFILE